MDAEISVTDVLAWAAQAQAEATLLEAYIAERRRQGATVVTMISACARMGGYMAGAELATTPLGDRLRTVVAATASAMSQACGLSVPELLTLMNSQDQRQ